MRFRDLPVPARWYVGLVIALATGGLLAAACVLPIALSPALLAVMGMAGLLGSKKLMLVGTPGEAGGHAHLRSTLSLGFPVVFGALLWFGSGGGMVVGVASALGGGLYPRRQPLYRLWFTSASLGVTALLTGALMERLGLTPGVPGDFRPLTCLSGTLTYYFLNTVTVSLAVALSQGASPWQTWRTGYLWTAPSYLAGALIVWGCFFFNECFGAEMVVMMVLCLYLVHLSFKSYLEKVHQLLESERRLEEVCMATVDSLSFAIDARDDAPRGHRHRAQEIAVAMGQRLNAPRDLLQALRVASLTHDVGKLAVPETILYKAGPLTPEEFERAKSHVEISVGILEPIRFPWPVLEIVRTHHERWDGRGYPQGLKGEAIPLGGRILAIADVFDTLTTVRPYRPALSFEEAHREIVASAGGHFDPQLVAVFSEVIPEMVAAWRSLEEVPAPSGPQAGASTSPEIWATIHGASRESHSLALTDNLTGLGNGRLLEVALVRELEAARRTAKPLSLLAIDLDGFKEINDTFGHQVGDEALRMVACVLGTELREGATVCRNGGDEFVVLLPETLTEQALRIVWRLEERISNCTVPGTNRRVGLSVGIATYPLDGENEKALMEAADRAMYANKSARRASLATPVA
jgi:diguanylate cyclase (GGDEF)-like protein